MTALLWTIVSVWVFVSVSSFYSCFSSSSSVFPSSGQHVFWEARLGFFVPDSRKASRRPQNSAAEKVTFRKEWFKITSSQHRLVEAKQMSSSGQGIQELQGQLAWIAKTCVYKMQQHVFQIVFMGTVYFWERVCSKVCVLFEKSHFGDTQLPMMQFPEQPEMLVRLIIHPYFPLHRLDGEIIDRSV